MKETTLTQLIEKAKEEVKNFGYSSTSINEYNSIFNEILNYFNETNVKSYDLERAFNYFIEKYKINNFYKQKYIKKYYLKRFRACKILDDLNNNHHIKRQYSYKYSKKITFEYYQNILNSFALYIEQIGLSKNIRLGMIRITKNFLLYLNDSKLMFKSLTYNNLLKFISTFPNNRKSKNLYLYYLRTFLNYLFENDYLNKNLSILIPNLKIVKENKVPSIWNFEEIKLLLNSIDRTTNKGIRNYAIIVLALTTGMRGCDIINLKIKDIDFKSNTINFTQEKTKTYVELPMLSITKNAIVDYILKSRPKVSYNNVFLTLGHIYKPFKTTGALTTMIIAYIKNLNLNTKQKRGIHSFRHTVLNYLFNDNETSLTTIAEIAGHNNHESLNSYIKTDIERLRTLTLTYEDFGGKND